MKKGFTLVELLLVIAIMGLMGTASVGGYRQLQRGMEERGVIQNVESFLGAALERANVDRRPTIVCFWNETIKSETADENVVVVGKAVAIAKSGRITRIDGSRILDEFGDLNLAFPADEEDDANSSGGKGQSSSSNKKSSMKLYKFDVSNQNKVEYSLVQAQAMSSKVMPIYITHNPMKDQSNSKGGNTADGTKLQEGMLQVYGFEINDKNGVSWSIGDAYGLEFQTVQLPHGYIFGNQYSTTLSSPIKESVKPIIYSSSRTIGQKGQQQSSTDTVEVYALLPGADGALTPKSIGRARAP